MLANKEIILNLHQVHLGYDKQSRVEGVTGAIVQGASLAIVGPNGGGKSTLLKGLAGFLQPLSGKIERLSAASLAYLPQRAEINLTFPIQVWDVAAAGLWRKTGLTQKIDPKETHQIETALARVRLTGLERSQVGHLSVGQIQRLLFARLLLQEASLMLLDEPFTGVDAGTSDVLWDILLSLKRQGRTIVAILHDITLVQTHFEESLFLAREVLYWGPAKEMVAEELYGRAQERLAVS